VANDIEVSVGFEDVQTLRRELVGISKDAKSSASVFEREYNKVERTLKATAKASQSYYSSLLNLEKASKSASASASVFEKALNRDAVATKNLAIEKDRLAKAYVPLYAQSKLYEAELEKLNRAQALGVISDKQRQASLAQLDAAFANGTGVFSNYTQQVKSGANRAGVAMQQFGYQAGDFLVQVQSGTNAFVAFGQQATQMVGFLPMMVSGGAAATVTMFGLSASVAAITLGLSIVIPLVTAAAAFLMRSGDAAKKASGSLDSYADAMKGLAEETANAQSKVDQFYLKTTSSAVAKAKSEIKDLKVQAAQAKKEAEDAAKLLASGVGGTGNIGIAIFAGSLDYQARAAQKKLDAINDELAARYRILRVQEGIAAAEDAAALQNMIKLDRLTRLRELALVPLQNAIALEKQQGDKVEELYGKTVKFGAELLGISNTQLVDIETKANSIGASFSKWASGIAAAVVEMSNLNNALFVYNKKGELNKNMTGRGLPVGFGSGIVGGMTSSPRPSQRPMDLGVPDTKKGSSAVVGKIDTQEEYLAKLVREYDMKKKSLGMTDQQIKRNEFIFTLDEKIATMKSKVSDTEIEALRQQSIAAFDLYQAAEKQAAIMTNVTGSLETMFMSFVDGTKSIGDAFKGMLSDIILAIYRQQVAETAARGIGSFLSGMFTGLASANGNVFSGGSHVNAYADGGVVGGPTYFPMSGGKTGLMGEAGPEAIMPLKRGANGKLGVQVDGSAGGNITVVQHNSFGAGVSRAEIQAMMPKIVETTKAAVLDAKKRGGSYGSAFA
jgi:hypothetical protein